MQKLHAVLAVEKSLEAEAVKILIEAQTTFTKKSELFLGHHRSLKMFKDDRKDEEASGEQHKEVTTTVPAKLEYISKSLIRHIDALSQKECTNQEARSDVVINGETLIKGVPATLLLAVERWLKEWRKVYDAIPTLSPGIKWELDEATGEFIWKNANPDVSAKTQNVIEPFELSPVTKEHPAQVEKLSRDKQVGRYTTNSWSGMITPARKSELLGRIDTIIRAVIKARTKANNTEVKKLDVGAILIDFINKK